MIRSTIAIAFAFLSMPAMCQTLTLDLQPAGAKIVLKKGVPNTWDDQNKVDKLTVSEGLVNDMAAGRLICGFQNVAIVTLNGLSWSSPVGSTGGATCDQCVSTPNRQTWRVISRQ